MNPSQTLSFGVINQVEKIIPITVFLREIAHIVLNSRQKYLFQHLK